MRPILISSGEPAGIGPDLCLALAGMDLPIVILGDKSVLMNRAKQLGKDVVLHDYTSNTLPAVAHNSLTVLSIPCIDVVRPGVLNVRNAQYVIQLLTEAAHRCILGEFSAVVTAPVHKAIINQAGFDFTGHTEFFAQYCNVERVVMMLTCPQMRVALVTTHLPLRCVPDVITQELLTDVLQIVVNALRQDFGLANPRVHVAGLNPHAGESGCLGSEEQEIIIPVLSALQRAGMNVHGPFSADTLFTREHLDICDALVVMYHDQGLPVVKFADFGGAVNVTLGLPIVRTSVDHGTALTLAGTGCADVGSLQAAVQMAHMLVLSRRSDL